MSAMDFAPSVYEHCALLIGRSPWEASRDAGLLYAGQAEAFRRYAHSPVVVGVDIYNLEAEAYGATVAQPGGNGVPAIAGHLCEDLAALSALPPLDVSAGRIPMVIDVGRRLARDLPAADVRIPVSGPFSLAANLMGFEALLCAAIVSPDATRDALTGLADGQERFCRAVRKAGLDIAFFESAAAPPLLSPDQFRQVELPALKETIDRAARIVGHPVPCVIGGDTTPILQAILETGTTYVICPAETDQAAFMAIMAGHPEVMVRVNMGAEIVSAGDWDAIRAEVDRIIALTAGREKACLGTGALPYETDLVTVARIKHYVAQVTG